MGPILIPLHWFQPCSSNSPTLLHKAISTSCHCDDTALGAAVWHRSALTSSRLHRCVGVISPFPNISSQRRLKKIYYLHFCHHKSAFINKHHSAEENGGPAGGWKLELGWWAGKSHSPFPNIKKDQAEEKWRSSLSPNDSSLWEAEDTGRYFKKRLGKFVGDEQAGTTAVHSCSCTGKQRYWKQEKKLEFQTKQGLKYNFQSPETFLLGPRYL